MHLNIELIPATDEEMGMELVPATEDEMNGVLIPQKPKDIAETITKLEAERKENYDEITFLCSTASTRQISGERITHLKLANGKINKRLKELKRKQVK